MELGDGGQLPITVSSEMPVSTIIEILVRRGCIDVTNALDHSQCGALPVSGGGFGDIFRGKLNNGESVAIKCRRLFLLEDRDGRKTVKRIARELHAWSRLKHPNVLELLGLARFRERVAMISLWMANGTLLEYVKRNPQVDRGRIALGISEGVVYLHQNHTVHGDIKSPNILVSGEGVPKLTDFGSARPSKNSLRFTTTTGSGNHSLRWAAPELLGGTTGHSNEADVYALGMTLLELVTGLPPFTEFRTELAVSHAVYSGQTPKRPETLSSFQAHAADALWQIMVDSWSYWPSSRPESSAIRDRLRDIPPWPALQSTPSPTTGDSDSDSNLSDVFENKLLIAEKAAAPSHLAPTSHLEHRERQLLPLIAEWQRLAEVVTEQERGPWPVIDDTEPYRRSQEHVNLVRVLSGENSLTWNNNLGGKADTHTASGSLSSIMLSPQRTGSTQSQQSDGSEKQYHAYQTPATQQLYGPYNSRLYQQQRLRQQLVGELLANQSSPQGGYVNQHYYEGRPSQRPQTPNHSQHTMIHHTPNPTLSPDLLATSLFGVPDIRGDGIEPQQGPDRGIGITPQLHGGMPGLDNVQDPNSIQIAQCPPQLPTPPQWSRSGRHEPSLSQTQGLGVLSLGMHTASAPVQPLSHPTTVSVLPHAHLQETLAMHPQQHGSLLPPHMLLQRSIRPLPPPPMQQNQQLQQHYERPRSLNPPANRRSYIDSQRTSPSRHFGDGSGVVSTENGQVPIPRSGGRHANQNELNDRSIERQEYGIIERSSRQHASANPVPASGYLSTPTAPPRPTQRSFSNWSSQSFNFVPSTHQADTAPPYNGNNDDLSAAMTGRRVMSRDTMQFQTQIRPQSAFDSFQNDVPTTIRQPADFGPRPLTEYENQPSPSELYRPPPLPRSSQSQPRRSHPQLPTSPPPREYTVYSTHNGKSDNFAHRNLEGQVDDLYGRMEEQSTTPLSFNTMFTPPSHETESSYKTELETGSPSFLEELSKSRTASPSITYTAEGTLRGDYLAYKASTVKVGIEGDTANNGLATLAPTSLRTLPRSLPPLPQTPPSVAANVVPPDFGVQESEDDSEDDGPLWQVPKINNSNPVVFLSSGSGTSLIRQPTMRPKGLTLNVDATRPFSQLDSSPASTSDSAGGETLVVPTQPLDIRKKTTTNSNASSGSGSGGDTVTRPPLVSQPSSYRGSQGWHIRPQAEEVYEKLEQFFPNYDLDKPVIDAPSCRTSLPIVDQSLPTTPALGAPGLRRHKKSIRVVAAERQKMMERIRERVQLHTPTVGEMSEVPDSDSIIQPGTRDILPKRSVQIWGGRVEEIKPIPNVPETIPEGRQRPRFKWVKGQLIGQGGFGRVYHAMNLTTGEMMAVKQVELPKTDSDRAESRRRSVIEAIKSESNTLCHLDHPHIVQYLGFEQTSDTISIFLEYVPGGSIGSLLRKYGRFEDEVVRSFSRQIIDGLAYLHSSGILHRDLKGDNILVDRSGVCKITGFRISKRNEHVYNNHEGTPIQGSVFWMAPEMLHSNNQGYNARIDIWSVGCVVLEMQTGRRPWTENDMVSVMYKVGGLRQTPPVPEDIVLSPLADDFRQKCFNIDPADRPTAAELLTHPWLKNSPGWVFIGLLKQLA